MIIEQLNNLIKVYKIPKEIMTYYWGWYSADSYINKLPKSLVDFEQWLKIYLAEKNLTK